jgi:anti-sigma regulatory factor (Ser/Thr protein kinase)
VRLELPSDPKLLCIVRGVVDELARLRGFSEDDSFAINLALGEAMTNIIRHAYEGRTDCAIQLVCRPHGDGLEFIIMDRGVGFDPDSIPKRPLGELRPGGWGRHIIGQVMDEVCYERREETNQLRLVKHHSRNNPKGSPGMGSP